MVSDLDPIGRIKMRFDLNIDRVFSIITVYNNLSSETTTENQRNDILRSAVVFIHAALEDLLRELIRWKAPVENADFASALKFQIGGKNSAAKPAITVAELSRLNGKSINDIIRASIDEHLEKRSYNDTTEITKTINLIGIETKYFAEFLPQISACITRRHNIVHRGDRRNHSDSSHGTPKRITVEEVVSWNDSVGRLGDVLLGKLAPAPKPNRKRQIVKRDPPTKVLARGRAKA